MARLKTEDTGSLVVAIDIGNTRIKAGSINADGTVRCTAPSFPTKELASRLLGTVALLVGESVQNVAVVIAGVVEHAVVTAQELLQNNNYSVNLLRSSSSLPMTICYDTPETLGVDRLANALYATEMYPGSPVVIIAAGTALVIDYVANGTFFGGAILPGIRMQVESLHRATGALPLVDVYQSEVVPVLPAASTEACIGGGVVRGCAAAVDGFIDAYAAISGTGSSPVVIATGGDWQLLRSCVRHHAVSLPELTLLGLARALPFLGTENPV